MILKIFKYNYIIQIILILILCLINTVKHKSIKNIIILKIFDNNSMYSLINKYKNNFINNKYSFDNLKIIKLNSFIKTSNSKNQYNYFAFGSKFIAYFYNNNGINYITTSPLLKNDNISKIFKMQKIKKNGFNNILNLLTDYKYKGSVNLYKYSKNKFYLVKQNIKLIYKFNNKITIYGN